MKSSVEFPRRMYVSQELTSALTRVDSDVTFLTGEVAARAILLQDLHPVFPSPWPAAMDLLSVLRKFWYQGSVGYDLISTPACIHSPRRKETVETNLEVAGQPRGSSP